MWYHVSEPTSYLAITGAGIDGVKVVKKAFVYPMQKVTKLTISPFDFSLNLQAMTIEKLQFSLPAVFTIGPHDNIDSLKKYATLLTGGTESSSKKAAPTGHRHLQDIVKGIIEGETRVIISSMTMEEIFKERQIFKTKVVQNVQAELDQFGLKIYNANVKELQDTPGSEYFKHLSRKVHEGAINQAKIDVAAAQMNGTIGEAQKHGKTKQEISKINAETAVLETKRKSEKAAADAELATKETELNMGIELAQIQATRKAEARDAELQKDVEQKRAATELERLRASDVTRSKIKKESAEQDSDAYYYTQTKSADAAKYKAKADAEAAYFRSTRDADGTTYKTKIDSEAAYFRKTKDADGAKYEAEVDAEAALFSETKKADASMYKAKVEAEAMVYAQTKEIEIDYLRKTKEAEANYIARKKEAEGLTDLAHAYGALANVLGGPAGVLQYLMLQNNTHEKLALANAKAVNNLQPKITVWNTGTSDETSGDAGIAPIRNLMQSLPPLFSTINDQTGVAPPSWVAKMGQPPQQQQETKKPLPRKGLVNGD